MDIKTTRLYQKHFALVATGKLEEAANVLSKIVSAKAKKILSESSQVSLNGISAVDRKALALILNLPIEDIEVEISDDELRATLQCGEDNEGNPFEVAFDWSGKNFSIDGSYLPEDGDGWHLPRTGGYYEDEGINKLLMPTGITIGFPDKNSEQLKARLIQALKEPRALVLMRTIINDVGTHTDAFQAILSQRAESNRDDGIDEY